eukprot:3276264-Prymnesium_polylepis.1
MAPYTPKGPIHLPNAAHVHLPNMVHVHLPNTAGRVLRLAEKSAETKLELLYKKCLFPTALQLAHSQAHAL